MEARIFYSVEIKYQTLFSAIVYNVYDWFTGVITPAPHVGVVFARGLA